MENDNQQMIAEEFDSIRDLVLQKNKEYGNSAFNPVRLFSTADSVEQIKVRIDDKLSRLLNKGLKLIVEDTLSDLIGYLILLRVAERKLKIKNLKLMRLASQAAEKKKFKLFSKLFRYRYSWTLSLPFGWKLSFSNIKEKEEGA